MRTKSAQDQIYFLVAMSNSLIVLFLIFVNWYKK
jgi:hypothetical protein